MWHGIRDWQGERELGDQEGLKQYLRPCFGEPRARPDAAELKNSFHPPAKVGLIGL